MSSKIIFSLLIILTLICISCGERYYQDTTAEKNMKDSVANEYYNYFDSIVNYYVNAPDDAFNEEVIIENNYFNIEDLPGDFHRYQKIMDNAIPIEEPRYYYIFCGISRINNTIVICGIDYGINQVTFIRKVGNSYKGTWFISTSKYKGVDSTRNNGSKVIADSNTFCVQTSYNNKSELQTIFKKWSGTELVYSNKNNIFFAQPREKYLTDPVAIIHCIRILLSNEYNISFKNPCIDCQDIK